MSNVTNIKIIVEDRYTIDYESPEDLGISFNRIVEDFTDLSKRFGEFSYTFSIPITKTNSQAFEYAHVKGRRGVFVGTTKGCRVYNNNNLLLNGVIELRKIGNNVYDCAFFSTFSQLIDEITDKKLKDIQSMDVIENFGYESEIVSHLNANNLSSDDTSYQFPQVFYSTPWTPYSILNGAAVDFKGTPFSRSDFYWQNWYYMFGSDDATGTNKWYHHQFPMGVYIKPILEGVLADAGWDLGGSFFDRDEVKKILMLYTGDNDIYDQATGIVSGLTTTGITVSSFLPDMSQTDFLKGLMNMFNLYFTLDVDNKIIRFETWSTLFSDDYDPYDITNKVFRDTITFSRIDNFDPSIVFRDNANMRVLGDNKVMEDSTVKARDTNYENTEEKYTSQVFNRTGTTSTINLPFGLPQVSRKYLRQDLNDSGSDVDGGDFQVFIPSISRQTQNDNDNKPFYKETGDTFVFNTEDTIKFVGQPTLMYYYGQSDSDYEDISGYDNERFYYVGIGSAPVRTKFGISNPFTLVQGNALENVDNYLDEVDADNRLIKNKDTAEASYLKGLHYMMGKIAGDVEGVPEYSLTFGEGDKFNETLWTKFHKPKYDLYYNSELLLGTMRMSDVDWNEMQINRPIKYNDELYSIISIENYDVVNRTAEIKLIKK